MVQIDVFGSNGWHWTGHNRSSESESEPENLNGSWVHDPVARALGLLMVLWDRFTLGVGRDLGVGAGLFFRGNQES